MLHQNGIFPQLKVIHQSSFCYKDSFLTSESYFFSLLHYAFLFPYGSDWAVGTIYLSSRVIGK